MTWVLSLANQTGLHCLNEEDEWAEISTVTLQNLVKAVIGSAVFSANKTKKVPRIGAIGKTFPTNRTGEGFLPGVNPLVCNQIGAIGKTFPTNRTGEGFLPCVMRSEARTIGSEETVQDILINVLYDLRDEDFKRFKCKLSDFCYGDKRSIGYGCLESANRMKTASMLEGVYGQRDALDAVYQVFMTINLRGPAEKLQAQDRKSRSFSAVRTDGNCTVLDCLVNSLTALKQEDFELFQYKLSDFRFEDKGAIGYGCLESANRIKTARLLMDFYGEMDALDVIFQVFMKSNLRGPAEKIQEQRGMMVTAKKKFPHGNLEGQDLTCCPPAVTNDHDAKQASGLWMEIVKKKYQLIEDKNALLGQSVNLKKRYTRLLLIKQHRNEEERIHEITSTGHRHLDLMAERESDCYSPTTIEDLFNPDEEEIIPKVVLLLGPAGIGKTMTAKMIMLDWASENMYQDKFDYVFYMSCREINNIACKISLVGFLSKMCQLKCPHSQMKSILEASERILFIIDGFDELKLSISEETEVCGDPFEETSREILLKSLLGNHILDKASIIITSRPFGLDHLKESVQYPRYVEVLGFTEKDREEYFYNFFKKEADASQALSVLKENETLFTMCAVPITCWIVCTVMKQQLSKGFRVIQSKTTTSIYLLYLKNSLIYHSRKSKPHDIDLLKKLTSMALEGVWDRKVLFSEEDLRKHGILAEDLEPLFLNENIFQQDIETYTYYSFIHLSIQEFFAALHYVLNEESIVYSDSPEGQRNIATLLKSSKRHPHLGLVVQFLFGLSGSEQRKEMEKTLRCNFILQITSFLEEWLKQEASSELIERLLNKCNDYGLNECLHCLNETQDVDFVKRMMPSFSHLDIQGSYINFRALSFCLEKSAHFHKLTFHEVTMGPKEQKLLCAALHKCLAVYFCACELTPTCCEDLRNFIITNQCLRKLDLSNNEIEDSGARLLCEGLRDSHCTLQELNLCGCALTSACCEDIRSVIISNQSLIKLELKENNVQDCGVRVLCEGLKDSNCTLKDLGLYGCGLTEACSKDLQSVIISNRSLDRLVLSEDELQESGIKILCEGLRHQECTLQELRLFKSMKIQWSDIHTMTVNKQQSLNRENSNTYHSKAFWTEGYDQWPKSGS
ncbi:NACHT, LRR and PYD domains-containing protein 3-like [Pelodytes ibericus]